MTSVGFLSGHLEGSGGLERYELEIGRALAGRGWDVSILYEEDGSLSDAWSKFATMRQLRDVPGGAASTTEANPLRRSDVLYVHAPSLYGTAVQAGAALVRPTVAHLHLPPEHLRKGIKGLVRGRTRGSVDPAVFSRHTRVDSFIAVSAAMARQWRQSGLPPAKIHVIHNGVDLQRFRPPTPDARARARAELEVDGDTIVFGYVGRIDTLKGIDVLLEAYSAVERATDRKVALAVVGAPSRHLGAAGGEYLQRLHAHASPSVRWLGSREDVPYLYGAMDVLVVPSQWDEPFGLVAPEAMAAGTCVIATNRGGLAEILQRDLRVNLVGTDAGRIRARMQALVDDPAQIRALARVGRQIATRHFDIERSITKIETTLAAALPARRTRADRPSQRTGG